MEFHLERFGFGRDSTLGMLYVPGTDPVWVLEDEYRDEKIPGETCIPYGEYPLELRTVGGFHSRYSDRFADMHRGMLWLREVPGFDFILIHVGNTDGDTAGCLLVGERGYMNDKGEFTVGRSEDAYRRIYPIMIQPLLNGEDCTLRVSRRWEHLGA